MVAQGKADIQKILITIGGTLGGILLLWYLVNKLFDGIAEKEFNNLLHGGVKGTGKADDKRIGQQTNPLSGGGYVPPPVSTDQKRITLTDEQFTEIVNNIGNTRHALSANDYDAALTEIERAQTKTDLALIISLYDKTNKQSILGTGIGGESLMTYLKGLSTDQKKSFTEWVSKLPDYV